MPAVMFIKTSHLTAHESACRILQITNPIESQDGLMEAVALARTGRAYESLESDTQMSIQQQAAQFQQSMMQPDLWTWCDKEQARTLMFKEALMFKEV